MRGLAIVGVAAAVGSAGAVLSGRVLSGMLYGITATDPATLSAVLVVVLLTGALAVLVPAIRATAASPLRALRDE
jgi:ABC-type antimicrobial peptide transport system permease subunit